MHLEAKNGYWHKLQKSTRRQRQERLCLIQRDGCIGKPYSFDREGVHATVRCDFGKVAQRTGGNIAGIF